MTEGTIAHRVLDELGRHGAALDDDDELARRLGASPRQTINQACRALAEVGRLYRFPDRQANSSTASDHPRPNPTPCLPPRHRR